MSQLALADPAAAAFAADMHCRTGTPPTLYSSIRLCPPRGERVREPGAG
jgi:hypothetical protein